MYNRCWRWRALLARRAESELTPAQTGLLHNHLAGCAHCRALSEADDALQAVLGISSPYMEAGRTRAFDDRVVAALALPAHSTRFSILRAWTLSRSRLSASLQSLPLDFMAQLGGGALLAASLTCYFLVPALHSNSARPGQAELASDKMARDNAERALFPVPMETLLNTHSPRAAMLWTVPERRPNHSARKAPVHSPSFSPPFYSAPGHAAPARVKPAAMDSPLPQPKLEKSSASYAGKAVG